MKQPSCSSLFHKLVSLLMLMALAACASSPSIHYYVLDARSEASAQLAQAEQAKSAATVAILQLEIPPYLDRPHLVSRDQANQLHIAELHQWGGRLRDNIARTLADDLAERLAPVVVVAAPMPGAMDADSQLLIDIRQFERLADGRVHLRVMWHVQGGGVERRSFRQHLVSEPVGEGNYTAIAGAMSALLAECAEKMAVTLSELSNEARPQ